MSILFIFAPTFLLLGFVYLLLFIYLINFKAFKATMDKAFPVMCSLFVLQGIIVTLEIMFLH